MRDSRARARSRSTRWLRTYCSQSRMGGPHDSLDGADEGLPGLALFGQHAASLWREPVEAPSPLTCLLDPAALDPAAVLETQQRGIERRKGERQLPARPRLDQLADF